MSRLRPLIDMTPVHTPHDPHTGAVTATIDLAWWAPDDGPLGSDRARELIAAVRAVIGPVVREAEADILRHWPYVTITRYPASLRWISGPSAWRPELSMLYLGCIGYNTGDVVANEFQLGRDGVIRWRRGAWERKLDARVGTRR